MIFESKKKRKRRRLMQSTKWSFRSMRLRMEDMEKRMAKLEKPSLASRLFGKEKE